jgi:hypothetical protein
MLFFSNFLTQNIYKLEQQAKDVLELPKDLKAFRLEKEIVIIDSKKGKIVQRFKDTLPSNPVRATLELLKRLRLLTGEKISVESINKKSDVWTCGFREDEARWVWYQNSEPKITVSYDDAFKNGKIEDKIFFYSARYGTLIVNKIKDKGLEKIAKEINALILENPFVKVKCGHCSNEENYTIDDIVDQNRNPKYDSNFVVCQNCNELVKLI